MLVIAPYTSQQLNTLNSDIDISYSDIIILRLFSNTAVLKHCTA